MRKGSGKKEKKAAKREFIEFVLADEHVSSAEFTAPAVTEAAGVTAAETVPVSTALHEMPPAFRELALPKLPELSGANHARLQMQSPNRLYFYWGVGANPYQKLNKVLGTQTASYSLVLKLVDLKRDAERIHGVDPSGSWWFDVESDGRYRAEIGFYAPNRPYVRVLFSNTVETPRKTPSPRVDSDADWSLSADRFSRVLEVAGFTEDAFDIALAGDDPASAGSNARAAFAELVDEPETGLEAAAADEIRNVLYLIASRATLESLRWKISPELFAILQRRSELLSVERALGVLKQRFAIEADEITEEELGPAVFGASVINFPKRLKTRRTLPAPISSPSGKPQG
jgi:hypothetical protein